jgi:hypothetical protein
VSGSSSISTRSRGSSLPRATFVATLLGASAALALAAAPKGAKAIFDSGEGGTIGMSANAPRPAAAPAPLAAAPTPNRYVGISYQIMVVGNDGEMRAVPRSRVFRSGERIKVLARTNRPGYLTVANIGSTGRMTVLFSEYVEPGRITEVPPGGAMRFDANPGTENILLMLSNEPNPVAPARAPAQTAAAPAPAPAPAPTGPGYTPPPPLAQAPANPGGAVSIPSYPLPPEQAGATMVASLGGAKSLKAKGAKDLVVEDSMQSSYTVISPRDGFKAVSGGAKDLVLETTPAGMTYGVVPVSTLSSGGILTLEIKLVHR